MATLCKDCHRPFAYTAHEETLSSHCQGNDSHGCIRAQLTQAQAEIAALRLEVAQERAGNQQHGVLLDFERGATTRLLAEIAALREVLEEAENLANMTDAHTRRHFDAACAKLKETTGEG